MKEIIFKDPGLTLFDFMPMLKEDVHQLMLWGVQEVSPFEWMTYLTEEIGELAKAISEFAYRKGSRARISEEAIQVATLALKISKMAEEVKE